MCTKCCNVGIIRSSSSLKFYWDVFIIILVIYNTFAVPFDAAFVQRGSKSSLVSTSTLDRIIDSLFCLDVIFSFRTSYFDNEGEEVLEGKKIATSYIKNGRFFIDFIASVPLDLLISRFTKSDKGLNFVSLIKLIRVWRINRLISMTKLKTEFKIVSS